MRSFIVFSLNRRQPWIHSPAFDLLMIAGPPLVAGLAVWLFSDSLKTHSSVGPWTWLILVVGIDVAHVYSSIFRTYLDRQLQTRSLLWSIPLFCWMSGVILYSMGANWFWTVLAYIAVFHFARQQYGFAMIYGRGERGLPRFCRELDRAVIYAATLYPLLFWHTHLPRAFNWLIEGDFIALPFPVLSQLAGWIYLLLLALYAGKELWLITRFGHCNLPRNLLITGTALSWYFGIVWLNNDLAFTFSNVVAHGLPYLALIWIYGRKTGETTPGLFRLRWVPVYLGILMALAYFEEGFWDGLIWRDHTPLFPVFSSLPAVQDPVALALLVPLLSLPQATHYVFDAFLWRSEGPECGWKKILRPLQESKA